MSNIQITQTVSNGMINLRVTWNQPTSDRPIQHYEVQYRKQGVSRWTSITPNPTTRQTTIRNVDKGSVFNVQVRGVSDVGSGQWRSATSQMTNRGVNIITNLAKYICYIYIYFTVPSQVSNIQITQTVSNGMINLQVTWNQPTSDRPIQHYEVQYRKQGVSRWTSITPNPTTRQTTIRNVDKGSVYNVQVRGVSDAGSGQWRSATSQRTNRGVNIITNLAKYICYIYMYFTVPSQVSNIQITQTVSNGMINLRVTWNQPTSDRPIQHYEVQYRKQGVSRWTSITPNPTTRQTTIRNVDKGSVFNVQVRGVSDVGSGQWRSATSQMTNRGVNIITNLAKYICYIYIYFTVPSQVSNIQITQTVSNGMINLQVTWNQPTSDRPIQHYEVQYRKQGVSRWTSVTPNPTTRQTTIRNVDKGSVYNVQVRGVSDAGSGQWRSATSQRTNRGVNIITNLAKYICYIYMYFTVPSQVSNIQITQTVSNGMINLRVTWNQPTSDRPIQHYEVQYRKQGVSRWTSITPNPTTRQTTIRNVDKGSVFNVQVRGVSDVGSGQWRSATSQMTNRGVNIITNLAKYICYIYIYFTVPSQVSNIQITQTVSNGMINLQVTWNQPTSDRPIQHYEVQYRKQGVSRWTSVTPNPTTRQTTIRNVDKGSVYNVQVRGVSDAGSGQWRSATSQRTNRGVNIITNLAKYICYIYMYFTVPSQVSNIQITQTVSNGMINLRVTWNQPTSDRPIQHYEVQYRKQGVSRWTSITPNPTTRQTTIRNVDKGSVFNVQVRGVSDVGSGQWRSATSQMTNRGVNIITNLAKYICYIYIYFTVPSQVSNIQITQTVSNGMINLQVTWNQPTSDRPIQHYEVQYRKQGVSRWTSVTPNPTTRQTTIRNVDKGSVFNVQVRAVSDVGSGQWRSATSQRTHGGMNIISNLICLIVCVSNTYVCFQFHHK